MTFTDRELLGVLTDLYMKDELRYDEEYDLIYNTAIYDVAEAFGLSLNKEDMK